MTITFLAPDGVAVTAQQFRQAHAAMHGGGSGRQLGLRSGFRVGTPSSVLTATSTTWTLGPCAAMIDPGATTHQGGYGWSSDANVTGSVTAADATYARKDIVYIQVNDSSAGDGSGALSANVSYLAGTASASPVAPTLPARSFLVGTISVPVAGGGSPTVTLNPARYVASGAALPATLSERDALTKYDGLSVRRMDLANRPVETWDGSAWLREGVKVQIGQGDNVPILKSLEIAVVPDSFLVVNHVFPEAFPNALVSTSFMRNHTANSGITFNILNTTDRTTLRFVVNGGTAGVTYYVQYQCWGY